MIDRVWAKWQERHGIDTYLPRSGYRHNNLDDLMHPYEEAGIRVTPADVADIRELGYRYDTSKPKRSRAWSGPGRGRRPGKLASLQSRIQFNCGLVQLGAS